MRRAIALPHLEGRRGVLLRLLYLALAGFLLFVLAGALIVNGLDLFRNVPNSMAFGFRTVSLEEGAVIRYLQPATRAAGVRSGDRVAAIDGVPVPAGASEFEVGARLGRVAGDSVALTLRHDDGTAATIRLPRAPDTWSQTDPRSGLPLWLAVAIEMVIIHLHGGVLVAASILLFRRRSRDAEAMLFAVAFLLIAVSPLGGFWLFAVFGWPDAVFRATGALGWVLAIPAIAAFPDGRFASRTAVAATLVGWLMMAASLTSTVTGGLFPDTLRSAGWGLVVLALALAVVRRYRATPAGAERQQIKWAMTGFCVALLSFAVSYAMDIFALWPEMRGDPVPFLLMLLFPLTSVALPLGLLVSLLRYRLYDAESAISRSIAYGVLTLALVAIFAGSEKLIEALGEEYFGASLGALAGGLGAAIAAVMIAPLHHRLTHWAERRFQDAIVRLRKGLPALVADLRETGGLNDIAEAVLRRIEQGTRAVRGALVVGGDVVAVRHVDAAEAERWFAGWAPAGTDGIDHAPGDLLFPVRVPLEADGCGHVGWILLGPRPDGSLFGKDEREALAEIADPVARAVAIVQRREARQAELEMRIAALETAVAGRPWRRKAPA